MCSSWQRNLRDFTEQIEEHKVNAFRKSLIKRTGSEKSLSLPEAILKAPNRETVKQALMSAHIPRYERWSHILFK